MARLWFQVRQLAPQMRTVLLTGPPDCGAEAVGRLLLQFSAQPERRFIVIGSPEADLRFAGLDSPYTASVETFYFIPEVDQLSLDAQKGLVRLLRKRRSHYLSVVASTSKDLRIGVRVGTFIPELCQLLEAVHLSIPALSDRSEDVPMLLEQLVSMHCVSLNRQIPRISPKVLLAAMGHSWGGNCRELVDVVKELLTGTEEKTELDLRDWARAMHDMKTSRPAPIVQMRPLREIIHEHISSVVAACQGKKSQAATVLGISRSTLYRLLDHI